MFVWCFKYKDLIKMILELFSHVAWLYFCKCHLPHGHCQNSMTASYRILILFQSQDSTMAVWLEVSKKAGQLLQTEAHQFTLVQLSFKCTCSSIRKNSLMFYTSSALYVCGSVKKTHQPFLWENTAEKPLQPNGKAVKDISR